MSKNTSQSDKPLPEIKGLRLEPCNKNEEDQSIQTDPKNVEITVSEVNSNKVEVEITFFLNGIEMVTADDVSQAQNDSKPINGFMGFTASDSFVRPYKIDTKKMPKLSLNTQTSKNDLIRLTLTPTIESNDTTVKVKSRFLLNGYLSRNLNEFPPGLKLPITQKFLGDFIVRGLDETQFQIEVSSYDEYEKIAGIKIKFPIKNAELNKDQIQSMEWGSLLENEYMAYIIFDGKNSDSKGDSYYIVPNQKDNYPFKIKVDFSFNIADSERNRFAPKVPPHSLKVPPHSLKVPPHSFKVPPHSGIVF